MIMYIFTPSLKHHIMTIQKTLVNGKVQVQFLFSKDEQAIDDMYFKGNHANYHTNHIEYLNS